MNSNSEIGSSNDQKPTEDAALASSEEKTLGEKACAVTVESDAQPEIRPSDIPPETSGKRPIKTSRILKGVEILFTALVASALSVATSLYVQYASIPRLALDYSWCVGLTEQVEGREGEFVAGLFDIQKQALLERNSYYIKVTSRNKKKAVSYIPNKNSYIGKMIIVNDGRTTATNIRIGIGYMFPVDFAIRVSPNVRAALIPIDSAGIYGASTVWPIRQEIRIEELPPSDRAFVTISWDLDPSSKDAMGGKPTPRTWYIPEILYLSSKESLGMINNFVPYTLAAEMQGKSTSETTQAFWAPSIRTEKGAVMEMRLIDGDDKILFKVEGTSKPSNNPSAPSGQQ